MTVLSAFAVLVLIASLSFVLSMLATVMEDNYKHQRIIAFAVTIAACWVVAELIGK